MVASDEDNGRPFLSPHANREPHAYNAGMTEFEPGYRPPTGLPALLAGLLTVTHERHMDMIALVSGLPDRALAWTPGPDAPHLSGLTMHILEVEEYLANVAGGAETAWSGELGSSMETVLDEAALIARIAAVDAHLKSAMENAPSDRWESFEPASERSVGSMLVEDLDHSAMHYGQMQLTRHLWELEHPNFASQYEHWR